ncbi:L,D-transpeptidase, partial [Actinotalea sp. JY-7885]|uniref:L,D-transpeptidase n=1 Tax=Actinotalea sp. JY-7885 TaxID=2758576 RepID=UPI00165E1CF4
PAPAPTTVAPAPEASRTAPPPVAAWTPPDVDLATLPVADPWAVMPQAVADPDPGTMPSGLLVTPDTDPGIALYDAPRGAPFALLPLVQYQGVTSYPVVAQQGDWYQVLLTVRRGLPSQVGPDGVNEATGWVHADDVLTSSTDYRITASLGTGEVVLHRGEEEVARTVTGFGTPETPTPLGRTFVMSIAPDPGARYSPVFVYLGSHSPTLDEFDGGPAPIAIHAYATYSGPISNGCLRVPADALAPFADVPLGTPVLVTA